LLFLGTQGTREVVVDWNADRRRVAVLVDGQLAASVDATLGRGDVFWGAAADHLDQRWLRAAIESLLAGVRGLEPASGGTVERRKGRRRYRGSTPRPGSLRSQFEIYASQCAWAGVEERKLAGLPCPLCGEPMILSAPVAMAERLVCPVCTRAQHFTAALMISLVVSRLRETFKIASSRLAPTAREELEGSIELLEQIEERLGGPSSQE
jgi:hypothetical protein